MDTLSAYAMGQANKGQEHMVFDWDKAAQLIRDNNAQSASAGLQSDWEWTGGPILKNGQPVSIDETYVYLSSTWAIPELEIDGEIIECYKMQGETDGWDADTYWPKSAIKILEER